MGAKPNKGGGVNSPQPSNRRPSPAPTEHKDEACLAQQAKPRDGSFTLPP